MNRADVIVRKNSKSYFNIYLIIKFMKGMRIIEKNALILLKFIF